MRPEIDPSKAQNALKEISLTSVTLGDYLVAFQSELDTLICDEPYIPLMVLLDLRSGRYLTRVWSSTTSQGTVAHLDDFCEVCRRHFGQGKVCIGCPGGDSAFVPRIFSKTCHRLLGKDPQRDAETCVECLKLMGSDVSETKCKVEISEEEDEDDTPLKKRRLQESPNAEQDSQNVTPDSDFKGRGDLLEANYHDATSVKEDQDDHAKNTDGIQDADFGLDEYDDGNEYSGSEDILHQEDEPQEHKPRKPRKRARRKSSSDDPDFIMPVPKSCKNSHSSETKKSAKKVKTSKEKRLCEQCGRSIGGGGTNYEKHLEKCNRPKKGKHRYPDDTVRCCELCGKQWEGRHAATNLVMHLKMFHEKSLKCPYCDYLCGYEKTLKRHMLKHLGCNSIDILGDIPNPVPNNLACGFPVIIEIPPLPGSPSSFCLTTDFGTYCVN